MTQISTNYQNNIQRNNSSVQGNDNQKEDTKKDAQGNNVSGDSVYGGSLNLAQDAIAEKKAQAGKQALKRIMDQFSGENKVDQEITSRKDHLQELDGELKENQAQVRDITNQKSDLMQEYEVDPESQEQQDLGLLEKRQDIQNGRSQEHLTEDESARLKEIDAVGVTEYQGRILELDDQQDAFEDKIDDANKSRAEDIGVLKGIHKSRLKQHDMVDAGKDAQAILDNASQEVTGMLIEQAVDTQDQKLDDIEEAAKKKKEEQEKQEETKTQNTQKAQNTQNANSADNNTSDTASTVQATVSKENQQDILQAKADQMVAEKKMTQEDIKGIVCDEII